MQVMHACTELGTERSTEIGVSEKRNKLSIETCCWMSGVNSNTYMGDDTSRKECNEPKQQYSRITRILGAVSVALMNQTTLQCVSAE